MSGMDRSDWDSISSSAICDVVDSVIKVSVSERNRKKCCISTDNVIYHPAKYQMTGHTRQMTNGRHHTTHNKHLQIPQDSCGLFMIDNVQATQRKFMVTDQTHYS